MMLFAVVMLYYTQSQIKRGHPPKVRKLAGLMGIEEAAGRCAEMGQKFAMMVAGQITRSRAFAAVAGFALVSYCARMCARTGAEPVVPITGNTEVIPMYMNILETAYSLEGRHEEFRPGYVTQLAVSHGSSFVNFTALSAYFQREGVGASGWFGDVSSVNIVAASVDGISIQGTGRLTNIMVTALLTDYCFIGEEMFAAGCYISPEPIMLSSLRGMDVLKLAMAAFIVVLIPLTLADMLPW
jgi:hypothetical protein